MKRVLSLILIALLTVHPQTLYALPPAVPASAAASNTAAPTVLHLENAEDVRAVVDDVLRRLTNRTEGAPKPVVLFVHDDRVPWTQLNTELSVALSRYGLDVDGFAAGSSGATEEQSVALRELDAGQGDSFVVTTAERASLAERMLRRVGRIFGMQQAREHFGRLRDHYRALSAERRDRREQQRAFDQGLADNPPSESRPKGDFRFEYVTTVPHGFGGGGKEQRTYLFIAGMNTLAFAVASPFAHGLPEALVFLLTYLYQGGQDYVNYLRQAGRAPRWEEEPTNGVRRFIADKARTFTRGFFFLVTFGVIAAANLAIMTPLMWDGSAPVDSTLWRILTNSLLGVFSFAPVEALIALQRQRQMTFEKEAAEKSRVLAESLAFDESTRAAAEAEIAALTTAGGRAKTNQLRVRKWYIGGFYPFVKSQNLLANDWSRLLLVLIGSTGFLIDIWRNGTRLRWKRPGWLGGKPATPAAARTAAENPCATMMYLTDATTIGKLWPQPAAK